MTEFDPEDERTQDTLSDQERGEELLQGATDPEKESNADWSDLPTEQVNLSDDQQPLDDDRPLHEPDTVPLDPSKERQREANDAPDGGTDGRFQDS